MSEAQTALKHLQEKMESCEVEADDASSSCGAWRTIPESNALSIIEIPMHAETAPTAVVGAGTIPF